MLDGTPSSVDDNGRPVLSECGQTQAPAFFGSTSISIIASPSQVLTKLAYPGERVQTVRAWQVCVCRPGGLAAWAHPIDLHYRTTSGQGWPTLLCEARCHHRAIC